VIEQGIKRREIHERYTNITKEAPLKAYNFVLHKQGNSYNAIQRAMATRASWLHFDSN